METKVNEIKEEVKAVDANNTANDEINNLIKVSKEAIEAKLGLFTYDVNRIRNCCPIIVKTQNVDEAGNIVDEDEITNRISITFIEPCPQYNKVGEDKYELQPLNKNLIISSIEICAILNESGHTMFANMIKSNPKMANLILPNANIILYSKLIKAGENFINPFSTTNKEYDASKHDTYEYHIGKIDLSKDSIAREQRMIDKLMMDSMKL